jgi:cytochrome c556
MFRLFALAAILTTGYLGLSAEAGGKKDDKAEKNPPSVKKLMQASFGPDGYSKQIKDALKEKDLDTVAKVAKEWYAASEGLENAPHPRGEKESWTKLTLAFVKNLKAVEEGAKDKDQKKAAAAFGQIGKACNSCHTAHKGKKK